MAKPTSNPLSMFQLPFTTLFPNFLRTWNYVPRTQWLSHFITINQNGNDAEVEQHVLGEVGSYGKQLGQILAALDVLIAHAEKPADPLTHDEITKLGDVKQLHQKVTDEITRYRNNPSAQQSGVLSALLS